MESNTKPVDVVALMQRIRAEVKAELAKDPSLLEPKLMRAAAVENTPSVPVLYSEELNYLNANWTNWFSAAEITSHRAIIGPIIVRVKRYLHHFVTNVVFKDYFQKQREFNMNLVRFLNATAKYIDARDAEIFWQIVAKIDADVVAVNERLDRIYDQTSATLRTLETDISKRVLAIDGRTATLENLANDARRSVAEVDELVRGVERIIALAARPLVTDSPTGSNGTHERGAQIFPDGTEYLLLENRFRGSEALIAERFQDYVEYFRNARGTVLDAGCGRGEFLELLRDAKIDAFGIDLNESMIATCKQKSLAVAQANCLEYLEQLPDRSLGGIFAAQLVEHLTRDELDRFISLAALKIRPGGKVLFETINPQSMVALAHNFFRDPTHIWPLHPDTLRFMFEMRGVKTADVLLRSPFPDGAMLQLLPESEALPARWRTMIQRLNDNLRRLNGLLYGHQDFCIVGEVQGVADRVAERPRESREPFAVREILR